MNTITVLLCDDHSVVREGLRLLLEAAPDIKIVGEAEDGLQAVGETKRLGPDVVLLDLSMPRLNGMEAARQISQEVPSARVLILTAYTDDQHLLSAVEAGAAGYLRKGTTAANDLLQAIREIAGGSTLFSPAFARGCLLQRQDKYARGCQARPSASLLSSRQAEVLQLIAEGYASKQIADLLAISIRTVEKHRQGLMTKLHLHKVALLTQHALSLGMADSNRAPQLAGGGTEARPRRCREGCVPTTDRHRRRWPRAKGPGWEDKSNGGTIDRGPVASGNAENNITLEEEAK